MPRAAMSLECIGDDSVQVIRSFDKFCGMGGGVSGMVPWVARLWGLDSRFGFEREFLRGNKDYSQSNSIGSRGVTLNFWLEDGFYEVYQLTSWKGRRRYFCRVEDGQIIEMDREEMTAWLSEKKD